MCVCVSLPGVCLVYKQWHFCGGGELKVPGWAFVGVLVRMEIVGDGFCGRSFEERPD